MHIDLGRGLKENSKYNKKKKNTLKMGPIWNAREVEFVQLDKEKSLA